jgi:hypothetical protein
MNVIATSLQFIGVERKRILDFLKFEYLENVTLAPSLERLKPHG